MTPAQADTLMIRPALTLLPPAMDSPEASVMLLTIALHESLLIHRRQINGPARGYWQFERGGVRGVLSHWTAKPHAEQVCETLNYRADLDVVYGAIEHNDVLAAAFARLLLYTDPLRLPRVSDAQLALEYYVRTWRPGAWARGSEEQRAQLREKWMRHHAEASRAVEVA